jgi:hypothetical protein
MCWCNLFQQFTYIIPHVNCLKAPLCIGPLPFVSPSLAMHIVFGIHFAIKVRLQNPLSYDSHFFLCCFESLDQEPNP